MVKIHDTVSSNLFQSEEARKVLGDNAAKRFVDVGRIKLLASKAIATGFQEFKAACTQAVTTVGELQSMLNSDSPREQREAFATYFSTNMEKLLEGLRAELEEPLPEDKLKRYKQQETVINKILDMTENVLVEACNVANILQVSEEQIREKFGYAKLHIRRAALITVTLSENHPYITEILLLSAVPVFEGSLILWPIARLFGISPAGTAKGPLAGLVQSYFFRSIIPANSWFPMLQKVWKVRLARL